MKKEILTAMLKPAVFLAGFAFVCVLLLASWDFFTQDKIAENERLALIKQLNELVPLGSYDNDLLNDTLVFPATDFHSATEVKVYLAMQAAKVKTALFVTTSPNGYAGDIKLLVVVKNDLSLVGIRTLSHKETPGLGDKIDIRKSNWVQGFKQKSLQQPKLSAWKVKKDGGEFDQLTGATITPRAIVNTVKNVLLWLQQETNANKVFR